MKSSFSNGIDSAISYLGPYTKTIALLILSIVFFVLSFWSIEHFAYSASGAGLSIIDVVRSAGDRALASTAIPVLLFLCGALLGLGGVAALYQGMSAKR